MFLVRYLCQPYISIYEAFSSLIAPEFKRARLAQSRLLNSQKREKDLKKFPSGLSEKHDIEKPRFNNFLPTTTFNVRQSNSRNKSDGKSSCSSKYEVSSDTVYRRPSTRCRKSSDFATVLSEKVRKSLSIERTCNRARQAIYS